MKPERERVLLEGVVAGVVGYAAVVLFFFIINLLGGRSPFHTPAALGSALFYGLKDPAQLVVEPGPVLAYNGVHLVLSLLVGLAAGWLVFETERHHALWYIVFFAFLSGFLYSLTLVGVVASELTAVLPWSSVVAANAVWILAMGGYLYLAHRRLMGELLREAAVESPSP